MADSEWQYRSVVPGIGWPAIPGDQQAGLLTLLFQLERSQWIEPDELRELQLRQLETLLRHAHDTVPYYRERWRGLYDPQAPLTGERFSRLPLLARGDLQGNFDTLKSTDFPASHKPVAEVRSSGSTGTPVRVMKTAMTQMLWQAALLREHAWHRRDLAGKLAVIRHGVKAGAAESWGSPLRDLARTGPGVRMPTSAPVDAQLRWLEGEQPDYLLTYPSNLNELLRLALRSGVRLPRLREVRTVGEVVTPELRESCREAWGAPIVDAYSAQEVGYFGLQCPGREHYHVQSETVMVEVIDEHGRPCSPGQVGLVVVTPLHNFAMPLVRYVMGDYAEVGARCDCGRGLPVLNRIVGRVRNTLVTSSGERYWPSFGTRKLTDIAPILQHQFVQKSPDLIEARLVTATPLTGEQEERLRQHILSRLPGGFRLAFAYCPQIPRSASGKFEDFVSEVAST
jgi:phenylacetate-CoA ligase